MINAPLIESSSEEERRAFIKNRYPCIADCDMCGLCTIFHGKDPENALFVHQIAKSNKKYIAYRCDNMVLLVCVLWYILRIVTLRTTEKER